MGVGNLIAQQHQDDRRRNDLPEGSGRGDGSRRQRRRVATPEHRRQRQEPHGDDRGADDARRGGEQGADDGDGNSQASGQAAEQHSHGVEQLLGHFGPLKHHAHEHEQGDGDQHVVGHRIAVDARRQSAEEREVEGAECPADRREQQSRTREGERDGEPGQQKNAGRREHQDVEGFLDVQDRPPSTPYRSVFVTFQGQNGPYEKGDPLHEHQRGEHQDYCFQQKHGMNAAGFPGAFQDLPGCRDVRP